MLNDVLLSGRIFYLRETIIAEGNAGMQASNNRVVGIVMAYYQVNTEEVLIQLVFIMANPSQIQTPRSRLIKRYIT